MQQLVQFQRKSGRARVFSACAAVVLGGVLGIAAGHHVIRHLSGSVSVVDGESMAPCYHSGERVYTAPLSGSPDRGDIVLIDDGQEEPALKRIVGLPGETIHLWRGYVFVNRRMLREPYLPRWTFTFPDEKTEAFEFQLGADQFFVLGDNRLCSVDSRHYGPIQRDCIKSRVPTESGAVRATFADYTLPSPGKRTIRPLAFASH